MYHRTTVQGATFNTRGQLYREHATAMSSRPVVSALGSESDDPGLAKSMYYRFHFVGATFGQHEFIRNLQHLSYSTSVTLILRKSSLALRARKAHNSLVQSQNPLAPSYRTRLFLHANVDNKNWPPLGV